MSWQNETIPLKPKEKPPPKPGRGFIICLSTAIFLLLETLAFTGEKDFLIRVAVGLLGVAIPVAISYAYFSGNKKS